MGFAFATLRLAPDVFWRMTPREIAAAFASPGAGGPGRAALTALMSRFPDAPQASGDEDGHP